MLDAVTRWRGNATAAWRELRSEGHPVPSLPTFHRATNRALTPGMRAGLRSGETARRRFDVSGERDRHHRNHAWETDHVEASVKVLVEGHVRKPWITFFVDCATSAICGLAITPQRPSREAVLVAIRDAVLIDEHHGPFGGIPTYVRVDGGKEFLCAAVKEALGVLGTEIIALPPSPPKAKATSKPSTEPSSRPCSQAFPATPTPPPSAAANPSTPTSHCSPSKSSSAWSSHGSTAGTTKTRPEASKAKHPARRGTPTPPSSTQSPPKTSTPTPSNVTASL